jgi:uncharacterized RDD family membrane protein YckC
MEKSQPTASQTDFLNEYNEEVSFEDATQGQRFLNYLIDLVLFYLFVLVLSTVAGIIIYSMNPQSTFFEEGNDDFFGSITDRLLGLVLYALFMSVVEGLFKGRTLGKLITGTKAIRDDGGVITWSDAFKRGFSRAVPFEPFSALGGNPWHDKWTDTRVVKIRK